MMATDTVPAAVPGPDDRPQGTPEPGLLASMLAPVDPARPAFNLTPEKVAGEVAGTPAAGVSSADYHAADSTPAKAGATSAARQQQSVMRAWLLAGAERWRKGGDARIKRLDLAKAKAAARQVKETRQVTVNRSGGILPKASSAGGSGGKSLGSKGNSGGSVKGPKNSKGPTTPKSSMGESSGNSPKTSRAGGLKGKPGGGSSAGGSGTRKSGSADKTGGAVRKGDGTGSASTTTCGEASGIRPSKEKKVEGPSGKTPGSGSARGTRSKTSDGSSGSASGSKDSTGSKGKAETASKDSKSGPSDKAGTTDTATPGKPGKDEDAKDGKSEKTEKTSDTPHRTTADPKDGKPFTTRESREAGYRDGTRAARTVAHAKAYRDGVKDGWTDTTEAADREKTRLDEAHEARKTAREKEQPVTGTASSADYHQPQPIGVKEVNRSHVLLSDGAAKESMSRGEVRSLKGFERRLREKVDALTRIADWTKNLKAHADEQAVRATRLVEAAKAVKGGEKLAAALTKLEEAAKVQSGKAEEIHKRAVRAAEACAVVLANAETRYGGIYQAVVDSDETAPAELDFYKD